MTTAQLQKKLTGTVVYISYFGRIDNEVTFKEMKYIIEKSTEAQCFCEIPIKW